MKNWFGEVQVTEVTGTLGHVPRAGLTPGGAVNSPLPRVHEAAQLGPPALIGFRISKINKE